MRVLFVIDSLGAGGAERSTAVIQAPLRQLGIHTTVACLYAAGVGSEEEVRAAGVEVRILDGASDFARTLALRRLLDVVRPDIVHTCLYRSDQIGRWATLGTGIPVVSSLVNTPRYSDWRWTGAPPRLKLRAANLLDAVSGHLRTNLFHAVTQGVADEYINFYRLAPQRVRVVERGRSVELAELRGPTTRARVREEFGIPTDAPVLASVGRLDRQKQHTHLVEAVSHVLPSHPDLRVMVVGRAGDAASEFAEALDRLGSGASAFVLTGFRSDATSIVAAADALVVHSAFEGAAGAAIEALGIGTPVVSYPLSGLNGVLRGGDNAIVAEDCSPYSLSRAIVRLLADGEMAKSVAASGRIDFLARFTLETSALQLAELYRSLLPQRREAAKAKVVP